MGFTNLKQPHSATRKDQEGRRVAPDTWYLQFQHDARHLTLPGISNFLSRTPWSVKSRTRTAKGKALIRENERWREKADPQSGMKVGCTDSLFSTTYRTCHFPAKPHQNTSYYSSAIIRYPIIIWYTTVYQIIHQREKGKTLKDSSDQWFHIISVVYHRGLPLLHFKRWASQYQQEVLPRWKMCTARARQKVLPSKWLIQLLKIACNDEMWSFPSMQ